MIHSGDQYYLGFSLTHNKKDLSPDDVDGIKLMIGDKEFSYERGEIIYADENNEWKCFLSQDFTLSLPPRVKAEVQVKFKDSNGIKTSEIKTLPISRTLFKEVW